MSSDFNIFKCIQKQSFNLTSIRIQKDIIYSLTCLYAYLLHFIFLVFSGDKTLRDNNTGHTYNLIVLPLLYPV